MSNYQEFVQRLIQKIVDLDYGPGKKMFRGCTINEIQDALTAQGIEKAPDVEFMKQMGHSTDLLFWSEWYFSIDRRATVRKQIDQKTIPFHEVKITLPTDAFMFAAGVNPDFLYFRTNSFDR